MRTKLSKYKAEIEVLKNSISYVDKFSTQEENLFLCRYLNGSALILRNHKKKIGVIKALDDIYNKEKKVSKNISYKYFKEKIIEDLVACLKDGDCNFLNLKELLELKPSKRLYLMSVSGISIDSSKGLKALGQYQIIYKKQDFEDYAFKVLKEKLNKKAKTFLFEHFKFPGIVVSVEASEDLMAQKKAIKKAQDFENIVQYMVGKAQEDFFVRVSSPDNVYNQHLIYYSGKFFGSISSWEGAYMADRNIDLTDEYFRNEENLKVWSLTTSKALSKLEGNILKSIIWIGKGLRTFDLNIAFVQMLIAMESLLIVSEPKFLSESITAKMADMVAFILSNEKEKRAGHAKRVKYFYEIRSKIVHSSSITVSHKDFHELFVMCKSVILSFLRVDNLKALKTEKDLFSWFIDKKYS